MTVEERLAALEAEVKALRDQVDAILAAVAATGEGDPEEAHRAHRARLSARRRFIEGGGA